MSPRTRILSHSALGRLCHAYPRIVGWRLRALALALCCTGCGEDTDGQDQATSAGSQVTTPQSDYVPTIPLGRSFAPATSTVPDPGPVESVQIPSTSDALPTSSASSSSGSGEIGTSSQGQGPTQSTASTGADSESNTATDTSTSGTETGTDTTDLDTTASGTETGTDTASQDTTANSPGTATDTTASGPGTGTDTTNSDTTASGPQTGTDTTSQDTSTSDPETETGSSTGPDPQENPEPGPSDPIGPQFGLRLGLTLPGPLDPRGVYRALVFEFDAQAPSSPDSAIWPELAEMAPWPHGQPALPFNEQGRATLVLPTPRPMTLNFKTGRSRPLAVTVYQDLNEDGQWSEDEPFVAALREVLTYVARTRTTPERWAHQTSYPDLTNQVAPLQDLPLQASLELHRLDRHRAPSELSGDGYSAPQAVGFLAMLSTAEAQDLAANYSPIRRPGDIPLRGPELPDTWTLRPTSAPAQERRETGVISIPGIRATHLSTMKLAGYMRPIGAPLPSANAYLTRDSTLLADVCTVWPAPVRELLAVWIDEGAWASSPEGALYAAWLSLGVGWGFVPVAPSSAAGGYQVQLNMPMFFENGFLSSGIQSGCASLSVP